MKRHRKNTVLKKEELYVLHTFVFLTVATFVTSVIFYFVDNNHYAARFFICCFTICIGSIMYSHHLESIVKKRETAAKNER